LTTLAVASSLVSIEFLFSNEDSENIQGVKNQMVVHVVQWLMLESPEQTFKEDPRCTWSQEYEVKENSVGEKEKKTFQKNLNGLSVGHGTFDALGLRAFADGPVRARLEDTGVRLG
jgi:hypothetical protein